MINENVDQDNHSGYGFLGSDNARTLHGRHNRLASSGSRRSLFAGDTGIMGVDFPDVLEHAETSP